MPTMSPRHRIRAFAPLAALCAALALCGCSSEGGGDWPAMFKLVQQSFSGGDSGGVALPEAAAIPYATLGLRTSGQNEQILVLATDSGGERLWTSGAHVALTTHDGRIVSTAGLAHNLSSYNSDSAFKTPPKAARLFSWTADFADLGIYSARVDCTDAPAGDEAIVVLGKQIDTVRVDETCRSDQLDWSFTNTYWISRATSRIWRSIQHVHPRMDAVEIELLRPPESEN